MPDIDSDTAEKDDTEQRKREEERKHEEYWGPYGIRVNGQPVTKIHDYRKAPGI